MSIISKTLYSRTSTGATQIWFYEVEGNKYRTNEGQIGGAKTCSSWTICQGKNIGRSNETTPEQQAFLEAEAKYNHKLARGYFENLADIDKVQFVKPMLAHKLEDRKSKVKFPVAMQPKLDGMRCIATITGLTSREGKPIVSVPHINKALEPFFETHPDVVLDGELYNHELKEDFNKIISFVKKTKPTQKDFDLSAEYIEYHVYDCILPVDHGFKKRSQQLYEFDLPKCCVKVETLYYVTDWDDVEAQHQLFVQDGYEGSMLRNLNSLYQNKRTHDLLKKKDFQDAEFEILDIEEGAGNRSGMMGRINFKTINGLEFSASSRGNEDYYKELLQNKAEYIGQMATVRFQNLTPDGIPRFPVVVGIRNYE